MKIIVPLDVPKKMRKEYEKNYKKAVKTNFGRLMLFAGDQKIEHLNRDFYGTGIPLENNDPEHLFKIASKASIGVFATQFGMIAKYGMDYKNIDYIVKMNSKTDLVKTTQKDPLSTRHVSVLDIMRMKEENKLSIVGLGYTIYLGSEFEEEMLREAAYTVQDAHEHGLISVLWIYPRGKAIKDEKDPAIIAGATGVACCLGSDFVKVIPPKPTWHSTSAKNLQQAVRAAGRTKVICSGESLTNEKKFLESLYDQIHIGGASGSATGRNIHQKSLKEAIKFANAIYAITVENKSVSEVRKIYKK